MRVFKSVIAGLLCFGVSSFAYDFKACEKRAALSMERVGSTYGVAIDSLGTKAVLFVYSPKQEPRGYKVLKHDPFVGMYLLESKGALEPINLKIINKEILEDEMASVNPKDSVSGKIATRMQSPIDFATLNTPTFQNSLISTICDHIYGIGIGGNAFIEKAYLDRFVNSDSVYYGDIGVRVVENASGVEVSVVDPFFKKNPFKYGDVITSINGEMISNLASFRRVVFDLKKGLVVPVQIKRNGVSMEVQAQVDKLRGGMLLPDNFFSRVHIGVSDNFVITYVGRDAKDGFERLRVGDRVLRVNQHDAPRGNDAIIHLLGEYADKKQRWLISRDDFQFFIDVNDKGVGESQISLTQGLLSEDTRFSF
ncbi:DUF7488 domain-containing protein [Helicobacter winghamensis]|uniref:PDZ domain-containing protein n=1 Tax=Helicobacter winghamensis TaxID=157268 RepID=A0A2N3PI36_9HELI|nr:PDZ domain-containing protein [Helicobacter winghamensis]EEO26110.1 hypothetical protein HWAG_00902 [Helicobacter winghamensis ATCC BAA-430]PKT75749.1 PDZ domain-containing protein [Helicobacter winghamensis]PKT75958.1 PDZ domain-containing protein [Helicobacter winghamensis]PKT76195.1 PDZ domain-containing protein [Helicobacter winghamensis]PKT80341.1 PDZ domain-containing protein [Helicobacter winghamensis]